MPSTPTSRRGLRRVLFWVMLLAGAAMTITWFVFINPMQRSVVYDELAFGGENSPTWWETHRRGAKILWQHDDFANVGENATKDDVQWIIARGSNGYAFGSCSEGHRADALATITNQDAGDTKEAWQQWWESHKGQTQAEWILKGFEDHGLKVELPLPREIALKLLKMIGASTSFSVEDRATQEVPAHIYANSLRLLRDTDFKPHKVTHREVSEDASGNLLKGLLRYQGWRDSHPLENGVGVVFSKEKTWNRGRPVWTLTALTIVWWGITAACLWGGCRGLRRLPGTKGPVAHPAVSQG